MWSALRFTLLEAGLSALVSVIIGAWLAHIWVRINWRGKGVFEALIFLPFFLPVLFVTLAVVQFYGRSFLNLNVYGLSGIVIAHVILNVPLVFYLVLAGWRGVAPETLMIAQNLGAVGALVERPLFGRIIPPAFGLIFLYASLSFTVVLVLGGPPAKNTLELAIYDAIRNRFDLPYAFSLAAVQAMLGLIIYWLIRKEVQSDIPALGRVPELRVALSPARTLLYMLSLGLILIGLIIPIVIVFLSGIVSVSELLGTVKTNALFMGLWNSLWMSACFAIMVNGFALYMVVRKWDGVLWLIAAISPLVIATFFFLIIRPFANPFSFGLPFILFVQVLVASPLFARLWRQALETISPEEKMLMRTISVRRRSKLQLLYWPRLKGQALLSLSIALALSIGDLALFPLMAPSGFTNLPILIWQMMSSYRFDGAMALGSLMIGLIAVILAIGNGIAKKAEARYA